MKATETNDVMRLLKIIHIQIEECVNTLMEQYELTAAQGDILGYILENGNSKMNSTVIHKQLHLSRATVSALIKKLRVKGFLEFEGNPNDDRQKQIIVTEKARQVEQELEYNFRKMQESLFQNISQQEIEVMDDVLKRMFENLQRKTRKENAT
ncbi:MarR family winged helix-turn-helix transcriptional regulator [Velocimicrobium porci]|uniref:MarR family transcriptional regulator n=1 Tax=Velocimicrobium porci TaxID=2606634 RepID=A0A6L5Y172_9FIRM|nr:MarR family transcriptional regulator [Velocimicrobium porci]MSS64158.1 MarR family transcriptional regulator [Velocimicrobium porci]